MNAPWRQYRHMQLHTAALGEETIYFFRSGLKDSSKELRKALALNPILLMLRFPLRRTFTRKV